MLRSPHHKPLPLVGSRTAPWHQAHVMLRQLPLDCSVSAAPVWISIVRIATATSGTSSNISIICPLMAKQATEGLPQPLKLSTPLLATLQLHPAQAPTLSNSATTSPVSILLLSLPRPALSARVHRPRTMARPICHHRRWRGHRCVGPLALLRLCQMPFYRPQSPLKHRNNKEWPMQRDRRNRRGTVMSTLRCTPVSEWMPPRYSSVRTSSTLTQTSTVPDCYLSQRL